MIGLRGYFAMAGAVALLGAAGYVWALKASVAKLTAGKAVLVSKLATCEARKVNLKEDGKSDAEIDAIPDTDLTTVPDHWLFP